MKHLAAYALCVLGGKEEPVAADVEKVLKEAGAKVDADVLSKLIEELKGKKLHEIMEAGKGKISSAGPAAATADAGDKKADPKDQDEDADVDVGAGGLFGEEDGY